MGAHHKGSQLSNLQTFITKDGDKVVIKPKALDIIWGNDSRYWQLRTDGSAELLQVCWLEVTGSYPLKDLKEEKEYRVAFKVSMKPDAFGWSDSPVYLMVKPESEYSWKRVDLSQLKDKTEIPYASNLKFKVPKNPRDGHKVSFGLYEIWRGRWKGGLVINEVIIEPVST